MELKKLAEADMQGKALKKIYCYERSAPHLTGLCNTYGIENQIFRIIDDSLRRQGTFSLKEREIPVTGSGELVQEDFSDSMVIITSDYHKEAYEKLCQVPSICKALDRIYYFADQETEIESAYREQYKDQDLEDVILFRSGPHGSSYVHGMDFSDNARALFEYMLCHNYNKKYRLVWLVKNPDEFFAYQEVENVEFLSFDWSVSEKKEERDRYYRALCLAKFLFFTDAYGFARNCRSDQIRVQLWHGCGFKTRVNFVRCEKRYEYTTVISKLYAKIHQDIYGLRGDQVLVTGYAKEDWLFHPIQEVWKTLPIPRAEKYIFWLPTFRVARAGLSMLNEYELEGQTGLPVADTFEKLGELERLLEELNTVLLVKLHPFQDPGRIGEVGRKHIVLLSNEMLAEKDIQINQLLGWADGLISDYSSAAIDYLLLDRPIGFTLEDVEEYAESRGFVFDPIRDWLPGAELFSFSDLYSFVKEVGVGIDSTREKRRRLKKIMHAYNDDQSCRRIAEALQITV